MILIDANILLYARNADAHQYMQARTWLDRQLNGTTRVGLPWMALLAFLRLATNRRIFPGALTMEAAWRQVLEWLACEPAWIPEPTERHPQILGHLLTSAASRSNLVADAHLAALAIEHGLTLCSADRDFARFPDLRWDNPLAG